MTATILDGKATAETIRQELAVEVARWRDAGGAIPCLAAVLVGDDPASQVYVRNKQRACERVGMVSQLHRMATDTTQQELLELIDRLNRDRDVHGILVQLPLPRSLDEQQLLDAIHPLKDVDAFHPENVGLISQGRPRYLPCTPHGVLQVLHRGGVTVAGREVVVVGRSEIVGKPLAMLLAQKNGPLGPEMANATVTICHSRTKDLAAVTRRAEVLIAAVGVPQMIQADMVAPGAAVVDVGINRTDQGLVGDVDFDAVKEVAGHITPVPGGVGPLTVTMLLHNTLTAAKRTRETAG
ncbi:MAG: bifunctional methylenetetrahydrofolate dehydrogenase/methenyltetrahydrofolate cyclohydrolase FolD [Planctomycetales bacterium]|nr:bifunctional methylenetetrahydrofolate dehydrogenase/methenyltetrahydrofolate cyclohydrolase FolD [Planctomycetales bacterium]